MTRRQLRRLPIRFLKRGRRYFPRFRGFGHGGISGSGRKEFYQHGGKFKPEFHCAGLHYGEQLKKLDTCAYHAIASIVDNTYTGENQMLGLRDGGVDLTVEGSNIEVSENVMQKLEEIREAIVNGEIQVPDEL